MELTQIDGAAPADSVLGMLQRGRGFGWLRAAQSEDGQELLLACIADEPRWDRQVESRADYYATLAVQLRVPVGLVADLLDDDEDGERLPEQVLNSLAERGMSEAADALRSAGLTPWAEEEPGSGPPYAESEKYLDAPVDAVLAADPTHPLSPVLLERLVTTADRAEVDVLRRCAQDSDHPGWHLALRVLAARADISGLDAATRVLIADRPGRGRHSAILYVERLPAEISLPLAREWLAHEDAREIVARGVLAEHAELRDLDLVRAALADADDYYAVTDLVRALSRLPEAGPYPEFETIYRESAYSRTRATVVEAMALTDPRFPEMHAYECLWDCESRTRLVAATHVPPTGDAIRRLQALADDPVEDEDVCRAAGGRLR